MVNSLCQDDLVRVRDFTKEVSMTASTTSLEIIKAVDEAVEAIVLRQKTLETFIIAANNLTDCFEKGFKCDAPMDSDETICTLLQTTEDGLEVCVAIIHAKIDSALEDQELKGDHEDSVVTEYSKEIELCAELHDSMAELRWAVMEHDADFAETTGSFDTPEALAAHLKAL